MSTTPSHEKPPFYEDAYVQVKVDQISKLYKENYGQDYQYTPDPQWVQNTLETAEQYWKMIEQGRLDPKTDALFKLVTTASKKLDKQFGKKDLSDTCINCRIVGKPTLECTHAIRTQKARGLSALSHMPRTNSAVRTLQIYGIMHQKDILGGVVLPAFVRPCPHRPRHGYIDSRVIETEASLQKLAKEVFEDDPQGEVMLTPVFEAVSHNMIWTPSLLTIGLDHDGATAGKNTVNVPLTGQVPGVIKKLLADSKVGESEDPYIEAIIAQNISQNYTYLTQLRAGPKGAVVGNFIPAKVKVQKVIQPKGEDLLQWEARIRKLDGEPGVVVYHPGGSPADHYSVHCRCTGVPVVYDHEPEEGEVLKPTDTPELDPQEVINGAIIAAKMMTAEPDKLDRTAWAELMLFGFHASAGLSGVSSRLLGASVISMIRLGMAALAGEARHCRSTEVHIPQGNRQDVWRGMDGKSLTELRAAVNSLINIHLCGEFASGGFGGKKWAQCGVSLVPLFNGLRKLALAKLPSEQREAINNLLLSHNIAVHQAHNGGWWMNKFVQQVAFDRLQENDPSWICSPHIIPIIYELLSAEAPASKRAIGIWQRWPLLVYNPPDIKEAYIQYDANWDTLTIKTKFDALSGGSSSVVFPVPDQYREQLKSGELYAEVENDILNIKTEKGVVLLSEPVLKPQGNDPQPDDDDDDDDDLDLDPIDDEE